MTPKTIAASRVLGAIALLFGLLTLKSGGSVLLDLGSARAEHLHYVPFVLWFNFLSGFAYVAAGIGLWLRHRWAAHVASALVLGLGVTSVGLAAHIVSGGAYDQSTPIAMSVRLFVWLGMAVFAWSALGNGAARRTKRSTGR